MSETAASAAHLVERLIADHRRIEEGAATVLAHCARGDEVIALLALAQLHLDMERHDGLEENALFPLLARKLPDLAERLTHVRRQHCAADDMRGHLEGELLAGRTAVCVERADELYALLVGNHTTEELVIYGVVEELLAHLHREESA